MDLEREEERFELVQAAHIRRIVRDELRELVGRLKIVQQYEYVPTLDSIQPVRKITWWEIEVVE